MHLLSAGARGGEAHSPTGTPASRVAELVGPRPSPFESAIRQAAVPGTPPDRWEFELTPYFWGTGLSGKIGVGQNEAAVDATFSDVFDKFDIGASAHLEAVRRPWFLFLDGAWALYETEGELDVLNQSLDADVELDFAMAEVAGGRRVLEGRGADLAGGGAETQAWLDLFAGARYMNLEADVSVDGGPLGGASEDRREWWVNPFVGARVHVDLSEDWSLRVRQDVGGFSAASDLTWFLDATFGRRLSDAVSLELGYRILAEDFETGTGSDRFLFDVTTSGFVLGLAVRF